MTNTHSPDLAPLVLKAGTVLKCISRFGGQAGISQIADFTGFSKSTIFRILKSLEETGLIIQNEMTEKYSFSTFFLKAGMQVRSSIDIRNTSMPIVERTAAEIGETTNLLILHENSAMVIDSVPGTASILTLKLPPFLPLYCSAGGKLFLSCFSEEEQKKYFASEDIIKHTDKTICTAEDFCSVAAEIELHGYSLEDEEFEYGLFSIAVPIWDSEHRIVAALSVSGPISRVLNKGQDKIIALLKESAEEIECRMGYGL